MSFERDYNKYLVLKWDDIDRYLSPSEKDQLSLICYRVGVGRREEGKKDNTYVVVNEDEPYAELVWALIQMGVEAPKRLEKLLSLADKLRRNV